MEPLVIADQGHFFTGLQTVTGPAGRASTGHMSSTRHPPPFGTTLCSCTAAAGRRSTCSPPRTGGPAGRPSSCGTGSRCTPWTGRGSGGRRSTRTSTATYGPPAAYEGFVASFAGPSAPGLPPHTQWPGSGDRADPALATFLAWQEPFVTDAVRAHEDMRAGAVGLLDRIGPSVLLTHSFGGGFGWLALSERPLAVKAVVAVEPAGPPYVNHPALGSFTHGLTPVPVNFGPRGDQAKLGGVPVAVVSAQCSGLRAVLPRDRGVPAVLRGGRRRDPPRRPGHSRQRPRDDAGEEQRGGRRRDHRLDRQAHVNRRAQAQASRARKLKGIP